jgi:RNA-dependent RNA polymerase
LCTHLSGLACKYGTKLFRTICAESRFLTLFLDLLTKQTPCRQVVVGFEAETSNRVVREFVEVHGYSPECFLRLNIGDEDGQKLFWSDLTEIMESRIRKTILSGLWINGRRFQFLAYSSSQLKECSIWMVCLDDTTWTVDAMRLNMGDFSKCTTPSKFAARMGQCFSTTFRGLHGHDAPETVEYSLRHVQVGDIMSSHQGIVHSDGNGLIRRSAMTNLLKLVPSCGKDKELNHSNVQIRYGGAKGTLVAWEDDDFDKCLRGSGISDPRKFDVAIRDSMVKFEAKYNRLEVCR